MKLKISGKVYDVEAAASKATLQTLYVMQKDYGVDMGELAEQAERFKDVKDPRQLLGNPDLLRTLLVLIWMARRYEGENMTLEESSNIPISDLEFIPDEEPPAGPDPKEPMGSGPDAEPPAPEPTTSKISKPRSTSTSRTSATSGRASRR